MNGNAVKAAEPQQGKNYLCVIFDRNDVSSYFRGIVRVIRSVGGICRVKVVRAEAWGGRRNSKPGHRFFANESTLRPMRKV